MSHKRKVTENARLGKAARHFSNNRRYFLSGVYFDEEKGRYIRYSTCGSRTRKFNKRLVNKRIRRSRTDMEYGNYRKVQNLDNLLW